MLASSVIFATQLRAHQLVGTIDAHNHWSRGNLANRSSKLSWEQSPLYTRVSSPRPFAWCARLVEAVRITCSSTCACHVQPGRAGRTALGRLNMLPRLAQPGMPRGWRNDTTGITPRGRSFHVYSTCACRQALFARPVARMSRPVPPACAAAIQPTQQQVVSTHFVERCVIRDRG